MGGSEGEETNETETNEDSGGRTGGAAERGVGESFSISSLSLSLRSPKVSVIVVPVTETGQIIGGREFALHSRFVRAF